MQNNKLIIVTTSVFLLISFFFLSLVEKKQADLNTKNIWMIYFEKPKDNSLDFMIENHSESTNFHWQILADKNIAKEGEAIITNGITKKISASITNTGSNKITVKVSDGNNTKEIYKNY